MSYNIFVYGLCLSTNEENMYSLNTESDTSKFLEPKYNNEPELINEEIHIDDYKPFVERGHFNLDEFEYERKGSDPGRIIIFNHENYENKNLTERKGSRRDVNEIILCFQRLGFNIRSNDILTDATVSEIINKLKSVLEDKESLLNTNSLIIFILTHGERNDELHAKDGIYKCNTIWSQFNSCQELDKKPKMFIFQACKGNAYTTTGQENSSAVFMEPSELLDLNTFTVNKLGTDMLLCYSTLEGNMSFRNTITGSWFIQELCKTFTAYGRRDDVISLITRVIKCVCGNYFTVGEEEKQMPIFVSTLSRKFYLNRNKDRHLLLEINRKQDEIYELLMTLTKPSAIRTSN